MAKLLSKTEKASCEITPDGNSIIFRGRDKDNQIYWPLSDWPELRQHIDNGYEKFKKGDK